METEAFINVTCEGILKRGRPASLNVNYGNWLPSEPDTIDAFGVFITQGRERIDITNFLSEKERAKLETDYLEQLLIEDGSY